MEITLAEALLRRKELQEKVDQLRQINQKDLFEVRAKRTSVTDSVDDIVAQVPKITLEQVTASYDWHARRLRQIDALIQRTNWETVVKVDSTVMDDYAEPKTD